MKERKYLKLACVNCYISIKFFERNLQLILRYLARKSNILSERK